MADRLSIASRAAGIVGAIAVLFPSDDRTRGWMRARGRDADWRRFEGGSEGFETTLSLDLSLVRPVRAESPLVRIGPYAEDEDVAALARCVARSGIRPGVSLEVTVPGRASLAAWAADGTLAALERAGANVHDRADPAASAIAADFVILGGEPTQDAARERGVWACAARVIGSTPAEAMVNAGPSDHRPLPEFDEVLEPEGGTIEHGAHHAQAPEPPPHEMPFRAVVLLDAGDDAAASRLLPWGPRAWAARADAVELAGALFRPLDTQAPARARAFGTCVVIAGEGYGGGRHSESVARATAALGVRAVFAASYAGGHDRLLALHGVLPLTWLEPQDRREVRAGDELEIPPPGGAFGVGSRVAVRHLTRGFTFDVRCDLEPELRELARAGGLLRALREERTEAS
jgi:aconitate hydratase